MIRIEVLIRSFYFNKKVILYCTNYLPSKELGITEVRKVENYILKHILFQ